jgi:3-methyl-2-oxobutanoate hydroxymethyltransferase
VFVKNKITVPKILQMKKDDEKIAALTAYDFLFAQILDMSNIDIVLVGDSASMVFSGQNNTLPYTMDEAIYHCKAVNRGLKRALLVGDMPFLSFQVSIEDTMKNAGRFFKEAEVDAVKVEGGVVMAPTIDRLVQSGMPVMGHIGLQPQSIRRYGSYAVQARSEVDATKLLKDALAIQQAGAFAVVIEKIPYKLAQKVTNQLAIPTIGIGAGPYCDGQILVTHDLLGLFEKFKPSFVRRYANLADDIGKACSNYGKDVKSGSFPNIDESFS